MIGIDKLSDKILIVFGSQSGEDKVSRKSAEFVAKSVLRAGYKNVTSVEVDCLNLVNILEKERPKVVFNAMHGAFGEDGQLQSVLNHMKIPYTHSGASTSFIGMDKILTHNILKMHNITTAPFACIKFKSLVEGKGRDIIKQADLKGRKFVIKPSSFGSSLGVFVFNLDDSFSSDGIIDDLKRTGFFRDDDYFIIEEFIFGREFDIVVLEFRGEIKCGVFEVELDGDLYDYESKYSQSSKCKRIFMPKIESHILGSIVELGIKMHKTLGCRNVSRSEFKLHKETGELFALELNTHPGLSEASFVPQFANLSKIDISNIFDEFLERAKHE